jgi:Endonuclease-reverse transcriptase
VTIVGAYLHPNMKHDTATDELLSTLQFLLNFNNLIFAGDFNCCMDTNNPKKDAILDIIGDNNLALINDFPYKYTYICNNGGSVVDVIFVARDIKPKVFKIIDLHKKKHRMLGFNFKMGKMNSINYNLVSKRLNIDEVTLKENFDNNIIKKY